MICNSLVSFSQTSKPSRMVQTATPHVLVNMRWNRFLPVYQYTSGVHVREQNAKLPLDHWAKKAKTASISPHINPFMTSMEHGNAYLFRSHRGRLRTRGTCLVPPPCHKSTIKWDVSPFRGLCPILSFIEQRADLIFCTVRGLRGIIIPLPVSLT